MGLTVISANIEGLTAVKASILSEMCKRERVLSLAVSPRDTLICQSPKAKDSWNVTSSERPHNKYGSAILIRNDLKVKKIYDRVNWGPIAGGGEV